jgi:hypothetical protein
MTERVQKFASVFDAPAGIRDAYLDEMMAEHREELAEDWYETTCSHVVGHGARFDGPRMYARRVRLGLSRADVEDMLLDSGFDVTVDAIESYEHGLWEANAKDAPALKAEEFLALPRLLGGTLGDYVNCWTCYFAAHPERRPEPPTPGALDGFDMEKYWRKLGEKFVAARAYHELTREQAAAKACIRPRDAELLERGKGCVGFNEFLAYCAVLTVAIPKWALMFTSDGNDDEDDGDDGEPQPEPTPDGGTAVKADEVVLAA